MGVGVRGSMRSVELKLAFVAPLTAAVVSLVTQTAVAQEVGTAAAVNPAAQARGVGGSRTIVLGQSITHRERIQTTSAGSVQLIFLDKSSMTVGPNSDLAIDEYVYDPATNKGKLAASLTRGVMRFVGGQISHAGNAQIATPTAVVGIRGGVGIFHTNSVYIGFGQGEVRSGSSSVTLDAGEYTQTMGGGAPPTPPGPPPAGFLQSVLATLQSQPGQGGGARASAGQVNQARRIATGSATGTIATNLQSALNRPIDYATETLYWLNLAIHTTARGSDERRTRDSGPSDLDDTFSNQLRLDSTTINANSGGSGNTGTTTGTTGGSGSSGGTTSKQTLVGYTGGLIHSIGSHGSIGQSFGATGITVLQIDSAQDRSQADFTISSTSRQSQNSFQTGSIQFGSVDTNRTSGNITIHELDGLVGTASALTPAVGSNGAPVSIVNGVTLTGHEGVFVEFQPGSQLSTALSRRVGTSFCQCEYTRWGLWNSEFARPGPNNSSIEERAQMFWVAGRLPGAGQVPVTGTATYNGHAIAAIRNGNQTYVSAGSFQNVVNFGSRSGSVTVTGLDSTNYAGRMTFSSSDSRFFSGTLSGLNNQNRNMVINGSFFTGTTSAVGEMGGALQVGGPSYIGSGIFAGRMR
jgi:hypothetical protein